MISTQYASYISDKNVEIKITLEADNFCVRCYRKSTMKTPVRKLCRPLHHGFRSFQGKIEETKIHSELRKVKHLIHPPPTTPPSGIFGS